MISIAQSGLIVPSCNVLPQIKYHAAAQDNEENDSTFLHVTWALGLFIYCKERHKLPRCVTSLSKLNIPEQVAQLIVKCHDSIVERSVALLFC